MLTVGTHVKNVAFLILGAVVLAYIGVNYADLGRYIGMQNYYTVRVELAETGGLFENANVTYRGVDVGRVGDIGLTAGGTEAELHIDDGTPEIPADVEANVANLSAVGEQYIDLAPRSGGGPYLQDGSLVQRQATSTPAPVTDVLASVNDLAADVPLDSLRTAVDELGQAFHGQGDNLQVLVDTGSEFIDAADRALPATEKLLVDGETVLRTQSEESQALKDFGTGAAELAEQLEDSDTDLRRLIAATPGAAGQVTALLRETDPSLSVLMANLTTTSELLVTRQRGVEELLVRMPRIAAEGSSAVSSDGVRFGMVTTFFEPLPCTAGYGATTYRNGLDTSAGPPVNTGARCTAPAGSGQNVRGSGQAPSGGVPTPAVPGAYGAGGGSPYSPRGMSGLLGLGD